MNQIKRHLELTTPQVDCVGCCCVTNLLKISNPGTRITGVSVIIVSELKWEITLYPFKKAILTAYVYNCT